MAFDLGSLVLRRQEN